MLFDRHWLGFLLFLFSLERIFYTGLTLMATLTLISAVLAWYAQREYTERNIVLLVIPLFFILHFLETFGPPPFSLLLITLLAASLSNKQKVLIPEQSPHKGNAARFLLGAMGPLFLLVTNFSNQEQLALAFVACCITTLVLMREHFTAAKVALNAITLSLFYFVSQLTVTSFLIGEWLVKGVILLLAISFLKEVDSLGEKRVGF